METRLQGKKILIVDDELAVLRSLIVILKRQGCQVQGETNAQEALRTLRASSFDLVLLDLMFPGKGGNELFPQIHRLHPQLPILIFSADLTLEIARQYLDQGARGYTLKPADPEELLQQIDRALNLPT